MTLQDLGNLGDFIGGLAVIITLIYLALQIRQNTRMLRSSAEQTPNVGEVIGITAQSPQNAAVYYRGLSDPSNLSPEERTHFYLMMAQAFYVIWQGHTAYREGRQSANTWMIQLQALRFYATSPGVRTWWHRQGNELFASDSQFCQTADAEIRKSDQPAVQHGAPTPAAEHLIR